MPFHLLRGICTCIGRLELYLLCKPFTMASQLCIRCICIVIYMYMSGFEKQLELLVSLLLTTASYTNTAMSAAIDSNKCILIKTLC